ncbi:16S rRNA processing protein RimM [Caloramator quimbayensis]|uniref:Ribosome maturation factor RimM n=1 Tax=Caloramator quimbayensis TaxID=1147123 RepID=A0A1T4XRJ2_9CLOT|nr:ribosome maturation factor RimM [Caloramator quimbayensis]SKA92169.1 16S rRNA processing protein RimM [Caloramator quimbayensis]
MKEYLKIGQIINTHGIKGEVKIYPLTDDVKRFNKLKYVFRKIENEYVKTNVEAVKYIKQFPILKLSGIDSMNDAEKLKSEYIYIDRENAVKLPENTYFIADLIGLDVFDNKGKALGKLTSVFSTGSNDVYEITAEDGKTFYIPAIKDVVSLININEGKMIINVIEGLL